jgi:hypothetical protein
VATTGVEAFASARAAACSATVQVAAAEAAGVAIIRAAACVATAGVEAAAT